MGLVVLVLSVLIMPALARTKHRVAQALQSRALQADATHITLCAYLPVIALAGVAPNAFASWWWAEPVAALLMVPVIAREGLEAVRGESD